MDDGMEKLALCLTLFSFFLISACDSSAESSHGHDKKQVAPVSPNELITQSAGPSEESKTIPVEIQQAISAIETGDLADLNLGLIFGVQDSSIHSSLINKMREKYGDNAFSFILLDEKKELEKTLGYLDIYIIRDYIEAGLFDNIHPDELLPDGFFVKGGEKSRQLLIEIANKMPDSIKAKPELSGTHIQTLLVLNENVTGLERVLEDQDAERCSVATAILKNDIVSLGMLLDSNYEIAWKKVLNCSFMQALPPMSDIGLAEAFGASPEIFELLALRIENRVPEDVTLNVQRLLRIEGYDLKADGDYGPITRRTLIDYQVRTGLASHGYPSELTAGRLLSDIEGLAEIYSLIDELERLHAKDGNYKSMGFSAYQQKERELKNRIMELVGKNPRLLSVRDTTGRTILMRSIQAQDSILADKILEFEADLDILSFDGYSAMALAAHEKLYPVVSKILKNGGEYRDDYGYAESVLYRKGHIIDPANDALLFAYKLEKNRTPLYFHLMTKSKKSQKSATYEDFGEAYDQGYTVEKVTYMSSGFVFIMSKPSEYAEWTYYLRDIDDGHSRWQSHYIPKGYRYIVNLEGETHSNETGFTIVGQKHPSYRSDLKSGAGEAALWSSIQSCHAENGQPTSLAHNSLGQFFMACSYSTGLTTRIKKYNSLIALSAEFGSGKTKYEDIIDISTAPSRNGANYFVVFAKGKELRQQISVLDTSFVSKAVQTSRAKGYIIQDIVRGY